VIHRPELSKKMIVQLLISSLFQVLLMAFGTEINHAQVIRIGLFPDHHISSLVFSGVQGVFNLNADDTHLLRIKPGDIYYATIADNKILLTNKTHHIGSFSKLKMTHTGNESTFQLKSVSPVLTSSDYDGDLVLMPAGNYFQIINEIDLEKYVAAVIEAEGGADAHPEFYKAQAILVRTYAIKNMYRHGAENYNLCSSVHCQAYKGKSLLNRQIYKATAMTSGMVLTDKTGNLITTPYHSNCGGITSSASDAWQKNLPCLVSIRDPFCAAGKNHTWSKQITLDSWTRYLRSNGVNTAGMLPKDFVFRNPGRTKFYTINGMSIPMRKIRDDFSLKSAYFQVLYEKGDHLTLKGKGFGHGVGLCQEGAMEMARVGYTYTDIIHFYYQNVVIVDYHTISSQSND
jgi:stage II sporulation protein D